MKKLLFIFMLVLSLTLTACNVDQTKEKTQEPTEETEMTQLATPKVSIDENGLTEVVISDNYFLINARERENVIIDLLKSGPQHINIISTNLDLSIQKTSALLTEMVFDELIDQMPGDIYTIHNFL